MLIGSRILKLKTNGEDAAIPVRLFAPTSEDDGAWFCAFEIDWPDGVRKSRAGGADALQAVYLALQMIGSELYTSAHHKSGALYFEAPGKGYGFPVAATLRDLLVGDDKRYL